MQVFLAAVSLVVVPVFFQAPLVRSLPWLSLALTATWVLTGSSLCCRSATRLWGDLITGFTWTWLSGSIYWGWFRSAPLVHLPIEAIGLPVVVLLLLSGRSRVGGYFFFGSLLGTAVTDLFIYWSDLLPVWRQVMGADFESASPLLKQAALSLQSPSDLFHGIIIAVGLVVVASLPLRSKQPCWWAFSGAVWSTLIVDLLFLGSAFVL